MATRDTTMDEDLRKRYERGDYMCHTSRRDDPSHFVCECGEKHPLMPCHYPFNCNSINLIRHIPTGQYYHKSCAQNYTTMECQGMFCTCNRVRVADGKLMSFRGGQGYYPKDTWCLCARIARGELPPPSFPRPVLLPAGERTYIRDVCAFLIHHFAQAAGHAPPLRNPRKYAYYDKERTTALLQLLVPKIRPHAPDVDIPRVVIQHVLDERLRDTSAFDHYKLPFFFHGKHLRSIRRTQAEIDDHNARYAQWLVMYKAALASGSPPPPFPASTLPSQ